MTDQTRWNLVVCRNTDDTPRQFFASQFLASQFFASQGRGRKGESPRFVEEAVQARILELEAGQAKAANSAYSPAMIEDTIDEALEWARRG